METVSKNMRKIMSIRVDRYAVMVVFLIIAAVSLPVIYKLYTLADLWMQMAGALLGLVFAAVITSVMLKWQTRTETEKERTAKVYEQKLIVCLDFLKEICDILQDGKVTAEEANRLKFDFANIAIHLSEESLVKISDSLGLIVESCGGVSGGENDKDASSCLELHVMNIVTVFRSEMYGNVHSPAALKAITENLTRITNQVEVETDESAGTVVREAADTPLLDALVHSLRDQVNQDAWSISIYNGSVQIISKDPDWNTSEKMVIRLTYDSPTFYYFQCHVDLPDELGRRRNLYMPMRTALGGRLNKYCWWRRVSEKYEPLIISETRSEAETSELLAYLQQELLSVIAYTERFISIERKIRSLQEATAAKQWGWSAWGDEGILFIHRKYESVVCDFTYAPDGHYKTVRLRLRGISEELQQKWLAALGMEGANAESIILKDDVADDSGMVEILKKISNSLI